MLANYYIPEANYMYLQGDTLGEAITSILPSNQFMRFGVFAIIAFILFGLEFLTFFLIRYFRKKKEAGSTPLKED